MYDRQFFVVFWGPVGLASTAGFAHLRGSSIFGVTSFFSLQFGMGAAGAYSFLSRQKQGGGLYPSREIVEELAWLPQYGVVRFLRELFVLPG